LTVDELPLALKPQPPRPPRWAGSEGWLHEIKLDGFRLMARRAAQPQALLRLLVHQ